MSGGTPTSILVISLSKKLTGESVSNVLEKDWKRANATTKASFHNVGFDVDPTNTADMLEELQTVLHRQAWNGVMIGWCLRGYPERTELFEQIARVCVNEAKVQPEMGLIFCTGPQNLMEATLRNFPSP